MKTKIFYTLLIAGSIASCHKADTSGTSSSDFSTTETAVITDFTNNVALAQYSGLTNAAVSLNGAITNLNTTPTDANLLAAQIAWKNTRTTWEQCEGFLLGPVESQDYDPNTDTWPTDYNQMDSLLTSSASLQTGDVQNLSQSLRGYHPLEYMIFGKGGSRTAASLTDREKQYMVSLSADILYNNVQPLYASWTSAPTNYANLVLTAGPGNSEFSSKQALFLVMVSGMSDICNEVGAEKMYDPYIHEDSSLTESPYSGNTLIDFKNNIIGLQNVYLGLNGGKGLKDLVAAKNSNLDKQIQAQITSAISSFSNITVRYELAIYNQRTQVQQTMAQLATLKDLLDNDLNAFIIQYVKD